MNMVNIMVALTTRTVMEKQPYHKNESYQDTNTAKDSKGHFFNFIPIRYNQVFHNRYTP